MKWRCWCSGTTNIDRIPRYEAALPTKSTNPDSRPIVSPVTSPARAGHAVHRVQCLGRWYAAVPALELNSTSSSWRTASICRWCACSTLRNHDRCDTWSAPRSTCAPTWPSTNFAFQVVKDQTAGAFAPTVSGSESPKIPAKSNLTYVHSSFVGIGHPPCRNRNYGSHRAADLGCRCDGWSGIGS